ncbi:uncharacterized protein LOC143207993 isoform X4 [Lasioglossum baleicum]|uniref:uncharacterized protein LOC143207993 isoform X4 n=1 Tax=Lasioglossum baleicum TaxID=434251 RepID=UPI003FCC4669
MPVSNEPRGSSAGEQANSKLVRGTHEDLRARGLWCDGNFGYREPSVDASIIRRTSDPRPAEAA